MVCTVTETAIFAAGCFWGVEAEFRRADGVIGTRVGYTGGHKEHPTYRQVCGHRTGHAEAVEVTFDPDQISYEALLGRFWATHDPTQKNRQGPDLGSQYRSAIFYHDDEQKMIAEEAIRDLNAQKIWDNPIVTEVTKFDKFYVAEDYHQEYFARNTYQPYCQVVVAPKVSKFRKHFLDMLKKQPV